MITEFVIFVKTLQTTFSLYLHKHVRVEVFKFFAFSANQNWCFLRIQEYKTQQLLPLFKLSSAIFHKSKFICHRFYVLQVIWHMPYATIHTPLYISQFTFNSSPLPFISNAIELTVLAIFRSFQQGVSCVLSMKTLLYWTPNDIFWFFSSRGLWKMLLIQWSLGGYI